MKKNQILMQWNKSQAKFCLYFHFQILFVSGLMAFIRGPEVKRRIKNNSHKARVGKNIVENMFRGQAFFFFFLPLTSVI